MYTTRKFTEEEIKVLNTIKSHIQDIEVLLEKINNGRNKSIAITHLEDTAFRVGAAIATDGLKEKTDE